MTRRLPVLVLAVTALALSAGASAASAITYCVPSTSLQCSGTPKATLDLALAAAASGDNTIQLGPGTYPAPVDGFSWVASGPTNVLHIVGAGQGVTTLTPFVPGSTPDSNWTLTVHGAAAGSTISGLTVLAPGATTLGVGMDLKNVAFDHVTVAPAVATGLVTIAVDTSSTVGFSGSDCTLTGGTGTGSAAVADPFAPVQITNCTLAGAAGADGEMGSSITIDNSRVTASADQGVETTGNLSLDDDLITLISAGPQTAVHGDAETGHPATQTIRGATVVTGPGDTGFGVGALNGADTMSVDSAIITGPGLSLDNEGDSHDSLSAFYSDYVSLGSGGGPLFAGPAQFDTTAAPGFLDAAGGDYRLAPSSPLIDQGDASSLVAGEPATDLAGAPRIAHGRRDMGAFEYGYDAPVVRIAGPSPATTTPGVAVTFDGSASSDPDPGDTLSFAWSFDDGTSSAGAIATHAFATAGTHSATLTVTDSRGVSASAVVSVAVIGPAGPAPAPSTPPAPVTKATVSITTSHVTASSTGSVSVSVKCTAARTCSGTATLTAKIKGKTVKIGTASYTIGQGKTKSVAIHLTAAGRAALTKAHHLTVTVTATSGSASLGHRTLTISAAKKKAKRHHH